MGVTAIKPGILTTVQDRGRTGYLGSGFSPSGVMDARALHTANLLVDNDPDAPVLEFCLAGPTLRFTTSTYVAITGGDFRPTLDGRPAPMYTALAVHRGSVLAFGAPKTGMYGYLAIAGGSINAPEVMGSRSTNLKCGIGGWKGRALITGDYLPFCTRNIDFIPNLGSHTVDRDDAFYGFDDPEITLRVVPGPQEDMFTQDGVDTFYGQPYTTTSRCDRMGFRLDGPEIETVNGSDIISDGIALGAVQIPADPSSCSPIAKPPAATPRSAPSAASTCPSWCSARRAASSASPPSPSSRRRTCTVRKRAAWRRSPRWSGAPATAAYRREGRREG